MTTTRTQLLVLIIVLAGALRVATGINAPLWFDEASTWWMFRLPTFQFWQSLAGDVHPPLFFFIADFFYHLLPVVWFVRVLPMVVSLAAIPLAFYTARAWQLPDAAQWGGALLVAFSPFEVYHGVELRPYALAQLFYLLALYAVAVQRWPLLALANVAGLFTTNYGFFFAATSLLLAFPHWRKWVPVQAAAALLYAPWALVLQSQLQKVSTGYWISPPDLVSLFETVNSLLFYLPQSAIGLLAAACTVILLVPVVFRLPGTLTFLLPMLLALTASYLFTPVYLTRALLPLTAPLMWVLIEAWRVYSPRVRVIANSFEMAVAVLFVVTLFLANTYDYRADKLNRWGMADVRDVIASSSADVVYHTSLSTYVEQSQFALAMPQVLAPQDESAGIGSLIPAVTRRAMGMDERPFPTVDRALIIYVMKGDAPRPADWSLVTHGNARLIAAFTDPRGVGGVEVWEVVNEEKGAK